MKPALLCLLLLSSAPVLAVTASTTTLAITSNGAPVTTVSQGTAVTLTATVTAVSTPISPGLVEFCDNARCTDIHRFATAALTHAGVATYKFHPGSGSHSYQAVFLGTTANAGSSSPASALTVTAPAQPPTITGLTAAGTAPSFSLTATVGTPAATAPTGAVSFLDTSNNNATLASAAVGTALGPGFVTSFQSTLPVVTGVFTIGDFTGDGIPDLVLPTGPLNPAAPTSYSVSVLPGNGDGTFSAAITSNTFSFGGATVAGDFNQDGIPDLALAGSPVSILTGKGDGSFRSDFVETAPDEAWAAIATADFNHDGILDLAIVSGSPLDNIFILLGNGDGTFTPAAVSVPTGADHPVSLVAEDFNGDGIPDLALASSGTPGTISVFLGQADGTFEAVPNPTAVNQAVAMVAADFNGDGRLDLATANEGNDAVRILLGNGDGTFTAAASPSIGPYPQSLALGDFNGDSIADLAVGNGGLNAGDGSTTILLGNGDGTFAPMAQNPPAPGLFSLAAGDFNGDGRSDLALDLDPTSTMEAVLLSEPQTASATAAVTLATGPHAVVASYAGDSSHPASASAPLSLTGPIAASTLTLTSSPSGQVLAGQSVTLTATLSPATVSGHSTDGETITFADSQTAKLTGGVASVSYIVNGAQTVTATFSGDDYLASSTSNPISFTTAPPLATTLTVTATPSTVRYEQQPVTITATLSPYSAQGVSTNGPVSFFLVLPNGATYPFGPVALQSGTASLTVNIYPIEAPLPGSYPILAQFGGSPAFQPASVQTAIPITVAPADTTVSLGASPNPALVGGPVTLTATTSPLVTLDPARMMFFYDGTTQIGSEGVSPSSGTAILTISSLGPGTHTITAKYSGDTFETSSVSSPVAVTVNPFTLAATGGGSGTPSQTASAGGQAVYSFAITPPSGTTISAPVTFGVTGLPAGAAAAFSPASLPAGSGVANVTMTVTIPTTSASLRNSAIESAALPMALGLLLLPVFASRKNRVRLFVLALLLMVPAAALTGCGSGSSSMATPPGGGSGSGSGGGGGSTPQPQTYNLTITSTSSSVTQSIPVILIVN